MMHTLRKPYYLDYAATTPVDPRVAEAMIPWLTQTFGNAASRTHIYGWEAEKAVENARQQVAKLVHAEPSDLVVNSLINIGNPVIKDKVPVPLYLDAYQLLVRYTEMKEVFG